MDTPATTQETASTSIGSGIKTALLIDGSASMRTAYGYRGGIRGLYAKKPTLPSQVTPVAQEMCAHLADHDSDGKSLTLYWGTGRNSRSYEIIGEMTAAEARAQAFAGPEVAGGGRTTLLPALRYVLDHFITADELVVAIITDGVIEDGDAVKEYSVQIAREIQAGKRPQAKLGNFGVGAYADEKQMVALDSLDTGTGTQIWHHYMCKDIAALPAALAAWLAHEGFEGAQPATVPAATAPESEAPVAEAAPAEASLAATGGEGVGAAGLAAAAGAGVGAAGLAAAAVAGAAVIAAAKGEEEPQAAAAEAAGAGVGAAGLAAAVAASGETAGSSEAERSVAAIATGVAAETKPADDLTVIEGIGPKAAALLTSKGITSFDELANTDVKILRSTLNRGRMGFVDPTTWPEQARLAAAGQMDELRAMQAQLKGGKVVPPDPLTRIEGIGPKIESILNQKGISHYRELAAADPTALKAIMREAKMQFIDATSWPEQAGLAAAGKWDELRTLQEQLKGSRHK